MTEPGMLHSALRLIRNGECSMMVGAALATPSILLVGIDVRLRL